MGVGRFQLQDEPGKPLGQCIMQFAGHALAFRCAGQIFNLGGIFGELLVSGLQLLQQL